MAPLGFWESLEGQQGNVTTAHPRGFICVFPVLRLGSGVAACRAGQDSLRLLQRSRFVLQPWSRGRGARTWLQLVCGEQLSAHASAPDLGLGPTGGRRLQLDQ